MAGGRAVLDLTANDFEVLEDGKPQKIETFGTSSPGRPDRRPSRGARVD
jgi:hypothetical protein